MNKDEKYGNGIGLTEDLPIFVAVAISDHSFTTLVFGIFVCCQSIPNGHDGFRDNFEHDIQ